MNRRRYLTSLTAIAGLGLAGCTEQSPDGADTPEDGPSPTPDPTRSPMPDPTPSPTPDPTPSPTPETDATLDAGDYTARLSRPRVRASVRTFGVHVDVDAEPDTQFLVVDIETDGTNVDDLPVSLVADGSTLTERTSVAGRPESFDDGPVALPVPVGSYESVAIVLDADGESDRWPVPDGIVTTLGRAPDFRVESLDVPESIQPGESFETSFTVSNHGARDARFLAEFGHGFISDVGEVEVSVPTGERRTHDRTVDMGHWSERDTVPVILDWGLDRRRVEVPVVEE